MKQERILVPVAIAFFAVSCAQPEEPPVESAPPAVSGDPGKSGTISGTVTFDGDMVPEAAPIQMGADPNCVRLHATQPVTAAVIVGDGGGLANAFVYVEEGLEGQDFLLPSEPVVLDQVGCLYTPRVFGVQTGQTLSIINSDETLHNVHALPEKNPEFNVGQPVKGIKTDRVFEMAEVMIPFQCDVHKWMAAYAGVVDHPFFAVTGEDGGFSLDGLPPGEYGLAAWHERYGKQQFQVTLGEGESKTVTFAFGAE